MTRTTLIALHGYSLNGAAMLGQVAPLVEALSPYVDVICPDGPFDCSAESVDRLYAVWNVPRFPLPYRMWWDATDDGREYRGWEATRDLLSDLLERHSPAGILGFSQGGMAAAAAAALSFRGEMPPVRFVIPVAGRVPRADVMQPWFASPISLPSLHVWGERDGLTRDVSPLVVERFDAATREALVWPGPHVIPTYGPAAAAIVDFVRRHV
jgi:hypothetical protein